jgi:hypothetical protein
MDIGIMNTKEMLPIENLETDMLTPLPFYEVAQNLMPSSYKNTYEPAYVQEIYRKHSLLIKRLMTKLRRCLDDLDVQSLHYKCTKFSSSLSLSFLGLQSVEELRP